MNHLLCTKRDYLLNGRLELREVNALRHGSASTHDCGQKVSRENRQ
jgi:hypothetical protein